MVEAAVAALMLPLRKLLNPVNAHGGRFLPTAKRPRLRRTVGGRLLSRHKEEDRVPTPKVEAFLAKVQGMGTLLSEHTSLENITQAKMDNMSSPSHEGRSRRTPASPHASSAHAFGDSKTEKALQMVLPERDDLRLQYENLRLLTEYVRMELTLRNRRYMEYSQGGSYWLQLWRSVEAGWEGFVYIDCWADFLAAI